MALILPYPPTVNHLYANTAAGRTKTPAYRAWCKLAGQHIMIQRPKRVLGKFRLSIIVTRPDLRRRDCTNLIKATEDALVANGVVEDDHLAESVYIAWSSEAPRKDATVRIEIEPVAQAQAVAA